MPSSYTENVTRNALLGSFSGTQVACHVEVSIYVLFWVLWIVYLFVNANLCDECLT